MKLAAVATLTLAVSVAQASSITSAVVYSGIPDPGNAGDPANLTANHANFTIGAGGINFNQPGAASIATFLNNPTFSNITGTFNSASADQNIELVISGFVTLAAGVNNFSIVHDDGAVITINGVTVLNAGGPTPPVTSPFSATVPSAGDYAFTILYAEGFGPPADLIIQTGGVTLFSAVPEPSSFVLLGSGLLAAAGAVRRRFVKA